MKISELLSDWVFKTAVKEASLTEGYESKILALLKDAGIDDCYFEHGTLVCRSAADANKAKDILRQAYPMISTRPPVVYRR